MMTKPMTVQVTAQVDRGTTESLAMVLTAIAKMLRYVIVASHMTQLGCQQNDVPVNWPPILSDDERFDCVTMDTAIHAISGNPTRAVISAIHQCCVDGLSGDPSTVY